MKMKFNKLVAFACFLLYSFAVYPQSNIRITGTVTDNMGETLVGVTIVAKSNPSRGVVTDVDGKYEISVPAKDILIFSYVGYVSKEVPVGTKDNQLINVVLEESSEMLEEVSVVGYGTQRKVSVIGSISTVKPDELNVGGITSVTNNLAGRIAGLIGVQSSGEPGSDVDRKSVV